MKQLTLDYTTRFSCLAGSCPDTCCKDWQIILDEDALARYRALPGALGEAVRAALTKTPEGETMFRLVDGHCALLREDGLCPIQCAYGEEALCRVCRMHPRFVEEYGGTQELTLALSCPGAARLLLEQQAPLRIVSREADSPITPNNLDAARYFALRSVRATAIALAQTRTLPIPERMGLILLLAERVQPWLDTGRYARVAACCAQFSAPDACRRPLAQVRRRMCRRGVFSPCWMILRNMEHLTEAFPKLLDKASHHEPDSGFDLRFPIPAEQLLVYFLFRYALKAVEDGQLLPRVEACIFHLLSIRYLCGAAEAAQPGDLPPVVSLYCKEVEHSENNLQLLHRVFSRRTLSPRTLYALLRP